MKITFVAISYENLGISQLSAIAKTAGHQVSLAFTPSLFNDYLHLSMPKVACFFDESDVILKKIELQNPDVIVFSPLSGMYQWALNISRQAKLRCPNARILFGGIHSSAVPERVIAQEHIDYVCVGEGDVAFLEILDHVRDGGERPIANIWYRASSGHIIRGPQAGFIQDLDSLPIFDKILWEDDLPHNSFYITSATRGCPNRCTYCFNSFYADLPEESCGLYLRRRSPEHMMHELKVFKRRYNFRIVEFFDDIFTMDRQWLKEFLPQYRKEIGVPFQIFTHVRQIDDERAKLLADAGCVAAQMGVQALDDEYKNKVLNRRESSEDIGRAIDLLKHYGVKPKMDHMLGLPDEPVEAQEKAVKFYAEHTPYRIQTYWTNYFPGTKLLDNAVASGKITEEGAEKLKDGFDMDTFTRLNKMIDPEKARMYQAYEWIYKLLPNIPYGLRKRLSYKGIAWMPKSVLFLMAFFTDAIIGLVKFDRDHVFYARMYLYWIMRNIFNSLKIPFFSASRIHCHDKINYYPFGKIRGEIKGSKRKNSDVFVKGSI